MRMPNARERLRFAQTSACGVSAQKDQRLQQFDRDRLPKRSVASKVGNGSAAAAELTDDFVFGSSDDGACVHSGYPIRR
jgi:hypothetical protein